MFYLRNDLNMLVAVYVAGQGSIQLNESFNLLKRQFKNIIVIL